MKIKPRKLLHNVGNHKERMASRRIVQLSRQSWMVYGYVRPRNSDGVKYTGPFVYISKTYPVKEEVLEEVS